MKKMRILLLMPLLFWIGIQILNYVAKPTTALGVVEGKLAKCADKPNSVCSQAVTGQHKIEPLAYATSPDAAWDALRAVVNQIPGATVIESTDDYLRFEFRTMLMRYVDDVEFLNSPADSLIHVRSASRIGHSDLGANRKRVERVRSALSRQLESGGN